MMAGRGFEKDKFLMFRKRETAEQLWKKPMCLRMQVHGFCFIKKQFEKTIVSIRIILIYLIPKLYQKIENFRKIYISMDRELLYDVI